MARLMTDEETKKVIELHDAGVQQKVIAKMFNRSTSGIHYLLRGRKDILTKQADFTEFEKLPDNVLFHHTKDYSF